MENLNLPDRAALKKLISRYKREIEIFIFRLLLDFSFIVYLDRIYYYSGFQIEFNIFKYVLSHIATYLLLKLIPIKSRTLSGSISQFFFIAVYIPFASFFAMTNDSYTWFFAFTGFWAIVYVIQKVDFNWKMIVHNKNLKINRLATYVGGVVFVIFALIFIYADVKFNFSLLDVYGLREENPTGVVPFAGYIINWLGKIFLPFLLIYAIISKQNYVNWMSILVSILIILLFSITGHKSYLMMIPAIIGTIWLIRSSDFFLNLIRIFALTTAISLVIFLIFDEQLIISLFVRRTLYVPAQISFYYYDFFQNNHLYLSNSVLEPFFYYPFNSSPPHLIGEYYFNKPEMSANNGIVADGFSHFGFLGLFIWSLIFSFLLKAFDWLSYGKNKFIIWTLVILGLRVFIGGGLLTGLLTHGVFLLLIIAFLMPREISLNDVNK